MRWWLMVALAVSGSAAAQELEVVPGRPIAAVIDGRPARLLVQSGRLDRLTLDARFVAANRIKPAWLIGHAELSIAGRAEFKGRNRVVTFSIDRQDRRTRAFWFDGAAPGIADATVGPWGLPQSRVAFLLGSPTGDETVIGAPMFGNDLSTTYTTMRVGDGGLGLGFDMDDDGRYPVASAAAGALLAKTFGGTMSGASWDVEVLMGVRRPVRLLTLERPLTIGPLQYRQIAVRVRDRLDDSGRGAAVLEQGAVVDPDEVVVEAATGVQPNYTLSLPRAALARCSRLTFDRAAKRIELRCK